jgi:type 2 lantibiotic biosynthesis protein LanM
MVRLASDLPLIQKELFNSTEITKVNDIYGGLSDPHNLGHSVKIITLENSKKIVYKPKDLALDANWVNLIDFLNSQNPAVQLKTVKTIAQNGYGWTEFIEHNSCESIEDFKLFYERSAAWLIIFHLLASSDMHFENIIACGSNPVPIDLEMILQAPDPEQKRIDPELAAQLKAAKKIHASVLSVGMLPAYTKSPKNKIYDAGSLDAFGKKNFSKGEWICINSDAMRWVQTQRRAEVFPNVPYINNEYAKFGDYLPIFIESFKKYALFLLEIKELNRFHQILESFAKLPVRKVLRPTRFYYALLQRLKDYRSMQDGISWSVQADFLARLGDWDSREDLLWPLQKGERHALLELNIPHFIMSSDSNQISDIFNNSVNSFAISGLEEAKKRLSEFNSQEIEWQSKIIEVSTSFVSRTDPSYKEKTYQFNREFTSPISSLNDELAINEVKNIYSLIDRHGFHEAESVAWLGLDWMMDSEVAQISPLGPDLYNGQTGVALFLAAYYQQFKDENSKQLLHKALSGIRKEVRGANASRFARSIGIGGASGLGSLVYSFTKMGQLLNDESLIEDALYISTLFTDELIDADKNLDVIGGAAGGILSLLALHRHTQSQKVLNRAIKCGEHLLKTPRQGIEGSRTWVPQQFGTDPLNGFSHGAAGFEIALSLLSNATGREDFEQAAQECLTFENANYDDQQRNWPDLREVDGKPSKSWVCQWCHGSIGVGLSRIGKIKLGCPSNGAIKDIENATLNTKENWPNLVDTLCCGTLGSIELLREGGTVLQRSELLKLAEERLNQVLHNRLIKGDYSWNCGDVEFNIGLFRGISGAGYTLLRHLNKELPNVLLWE